MDGLTSIKDVFPLAGPLLGVLIGFSLSQYSKNVSNKEGDIRHFKATLVKYGNNEAKRGEVVLAHASLPKTIRSRIDLDGLLKTSPDNLERAITVILQDLP